MPNMIPVILNQVLGAASFTIVRQPGRWEGGRFVQEPAQRIEARGNVQPMSDKELDQLPEGDRVKSVMTFVTPEEIFVTRKEGVSDELEWNGRRYKVLAVKDWRMHGFYKAFAHLKE